MPDKGDLGEVPGIGPVLKKKLSDSGFSTSADLSPSSFYDLVKTEGIGYTTAYRIYSFFGLEIEYRNMREFTDGLSEDVVIENKTIKPWRSLKKQPEIWQPQDFSKERRTVWSFRDRGSWATHNPQYRGNWSPYVVRNAIELYSKPGDLVLDPMVGGGTTPLECLLTGRNSVSADINPDALRVARDVIDLPQDVLKTLPETEHRFYEGDVRNLNLIADGSVDLVLTHPPYVNIIRYSESVEGDLSQINNYGIFFKEFSKAISEIKRVLKEGSYCAVLVGDTHRGGHYVPISARIMLEFLKEGFLLKEDIIKFEWNCQSDRNLAKYGDADFLLTSHEHLYVFRKVTEYDGRLKNSSLEFFGGQ
jgi:SAM-dependent methyltransferase